MIAGVAAGFACLGVAFTALKSADAQDGGNRVHIIAPAPLPPPIYGPREIADGELTVLDADTQYTFWTDQEEKWQSTLSTFGENMPSAEKEAAFARQALQNALRAQSAKIDAGLQRERATKRLEAMRAKNIEVQGGPPAK